MSDNERIYRCGEGPVARALDEFRSLGGEVVGGPAEGTLRARSPLGPVEGSYRFDGEAFTVTVTRVPAGPALQWIWSRLDRICGQPVGLA